MILQLLTAVTGKKLPVLQTLTSLVLAFVFTLATSVSFGQASITTDQPDYAPGSTATFTGAGFTPGDSVSLVVHHADGTPDTGADHNPWKVLVEANGGFITTWHVCEDDCLGSTLKVTADGTDGLHAEALFTDAAVIYLHDFGTTTITTHPYIIAPTTLATHLSSSSWTNSTGSWTSFGGSSASPNQAIALNNSGGMPTITLTFQLAAGYKLNVSSFSFWRQRSTSGAANWTMSINGISVGSGTVPTAGASTNTLLVTNSVANLTGTITVVMSLSGASGTGTFRLDDFTLNGDIIPPTPTTTSISPTSANAGGAGFTLTVNGTSFVNGASTVTWNGSNRTTTFVSSTQLTASIPSSDIMTAGSANVGVTTTGAAAVSNTQPFSITAATVNAGIFDAYAIMNFGGADQYYQVGTFNGTNFGTYNSSQSFYLDGAQNKTYKCSPSNITNGKLYYRIYPTSGTAGAFNTAINLPFASNDAGAGAGCQNQTWQEAAAGVNLLSGLCDGNYTIEIFTSADYDGAGSGTLFSNNGGANYKATFAVKNDDRSGIYQSQLVLKLNGGSDTYYDLQANTPAFDFAGSLGSFCQNSGSLVVAGAENKTFKCSPNDVTNGALYFRVYSGSPAGTFVPLSLGFISDDGASICGGVNQTWRSTSNATNILTGLTPGTYTLEVYTQAGYTSNGICADIHYASNGGANYKATFTVTASPAATASSNSPVCVGTALNFNASGGTSYAWSGPNGFNSTSTSPSVNPVATSDAGPYSVTVTDANGCSSTASTSVTVNSFSTPVTVLNESFGTGTTLPSGWAVSGSPTWSVSTSSSSAGDYSGASGGSNALADNNSSTDAALVTPSINFSAATNGILSFGLKRSSTSFGRSVAVEVSTDNGSSFTAFSQTIPATSMSTGNYILQTINLGTTVNNAAQVKIRWRILGTAGSAGPNMRIDDVKLNGSVAGSASISKVDNCGGTVTLTASAGTGYLWTPGNATTQSITVSNTGNYNVTVTGSLGCTSSAAFNVTAIPVALVAAGEVTAPLCFGGTGSVLISATGGSGSYSGTGSFPVGAGAAYSFTVTDNTTNCTSIVTGTMAAPTQVVAASNYSAILCNGGTSTVTVSATGGTGAYGTTVGQFTVPAGPYSFTVTDANGCSSITTGNIPEPTALIVNEIHTDVNCNGGNNGSIQLTVSGGTGIITPIFTSAVENFNTLASTGTSSVVPANWYFAESGTNANTTYTASTGSVATGDTYSFGVAGANPLADRAFGGLQSGSLNPFIGTKITNGTSQTINAIDVNYTGEQWRLGATGRLDKLEFEYSINATSLTTGSWTAVTSLNFIAPVTAGTLGAIDGNLAANRTAISGTITGLAIPPGGTIWLGWRDFDATSSDDGLAVDDFSYTLKAAGAYIYSWSNGGTTKDVSGLTAGNYTVNVSDANGCTAAPLTIQIAEPAAVTLSATSTNVSCNGGSNGTISATSNGTVVIKDASNNVVGSTGLVAGTYTLTATNAGNNTATCSATPIQVTIGEPTLLTASAVVGSIACNGGSTTVNITAAGGTAPYTNDGSHTVSAGAYSFTVTDANGCSTIVSGSISEPTLLTATKVVGSILCNGGTTTVNITAAGGTAPYTNDGSHTVSAGAYSFTVTDANGCSTVVSGNISEPTLLTASAVVGSIACNGGTTTVNITAAGGTAPYSGDGSHTVSAGAYSFTVTDANGCSTIVSGTISEPTLLTASAVVGSILCNGGTTTVNITAAGGTAPYTNDGSHTVTAGAYSFTVTDANGCSTIVSGSISEPTLLTATKVVGSILCNGGTTTVNITAAGGTAPYTGDGSHTVSAGAYSFTVTDANGCSTIVSGNISQPSAVMTPTSTRSKDWLYFGLAGDQTATITGTAIGGGTGPYTISITMNRALKCAVNGGNEIWTAGANTASSVFNTCANSAGSNPVSTSMANIAAGGTYSVNVTLMANATFTITVTDANGCTKTSTINMNAEDVRCFAGNSGKAKVKICHKTGNGCTEICVDESAVNAHLAHGDFLGNCTSTCTPPPTTFTNGPETIAEPAAVDVKGLNAEVAPNPTTSQFKIKVVSDEKALVTVRIYDVLGTTLKIFNAVKPGTVLTTGDSFRGGTYFAEITQGNKRKVVKLIKLN